MANLKYGSSGDDVKKLQSALADAGYDVGKTGADGVLGKNTEAAIKQYQKDNGLTVDGIAGKNTLGKLYGNKTTTTTTAKPATKPATTTTAPTTSTNTTETTAPAAPTETDTGFSHEEYTQPTFTLPDSYYTAQDVLNQHKANHPGAYTSIYGDKADEWASKYENRDPFSYNMNEDALYQQYKDQYIQLGQLASEDVMGQATAMTGGYGNSYAQSVAQQTYNQYLNQLNDVGLELYDRAYNLYNQEGQDMLNMYNLYMNREEQERAKYQAELSNWYDQYNLLKGEEESIYSKAWNEYTDTSANSWNQYVDGKTDDWNEYVMDREEESTAKTNAFNTLVTLITNNGYNPSDAELAAAGMTREQADSYAKGYSDSKTDSKQSELKNLIMGYGYNPTDDELNAAGMTRDQANGYLDTYKNNVTAKTSSSSGTGTETTKYTTLDYDEQAKWKKSVATAKESENPVTAINNVIDELEATLVSGQQIASLVGPAIKELVTQGKATPEDFGFTYEDLGISSSSSSSGRGTTGGGGGGVSYWEIK